MFLFRNLSRHLESGALEELTLTTNGSQLAKYAARAARLRRQAGQCLRRHARPAKFTAITRWGKLDKVQDGIAAAKDAGLAVKINAVALKGVNDDEIDDP